MKKTLLLLLALLATVGMTFSQDIWSCGTHTYNGATGVGIYKNGERVASFESTSNFAPYDILRHHGHTYLAYRNSTEDYAFVRDYESSHTINIGSDCYPYQLFGGSGLYVAGYRKEGSVDKATIWSISSSGNCSVVYTMDNGSNNADFYCGLLDTSPSHYIYAGGYRKTGSNSWEGVIWKEQTGVLYTIPQEKSYVMSMAYYDGNVYSLVLTNASNHVWVYKNDELLYTLNTDDSHNIQDLYIDGGDIYVCGSSGSTQKVWKNGEVLYSPSGQNISGVWTNSDGIYFCGKKDDVGTIWKDGEVIYQPSNCTSMIKLYVEAPECANDEIRTLPYFEGFETGETDWECWTKIDVDNSNGTNSSYWDRNGQCLALAGITSHTGDHYARHQRRVSGTAQEGWLISPRVFITPNNPTLSFFTKRGWDDASDYASIWVSTDSDPTNLGSYYEIYTVPDHNSWAEVTVNLSAYHGQAVYIAFKYSADAATRAPSWNIDDISIYEDWTPCPPVTAFPYTEDFSGNTPCWYIVDVDNSYPSWNLSGSSASHWYGDETTLQQGALCTPYFQLAAGENYTLTFNSKATWYADDMASLVAISVDKTGVPYLGDFDEIWSDDFSTLGEWQTVTIDLSAYAGHTICLAFGYEGTDAHEWIVDDVTITETTPTYTINVESNNAAWGTVSGGGTLEQGASCTIEATAASGYEFKKWTKGGEDVSTNASYTFTVTENATYTAVFGEPAVNYYTIATVASPASGGTVEGGGTYAQGTEVTLTATPKTGYHFTKWTDGNTSNPRTITVTGDATYTAKFSKNKYTVTVTAIPADGGTVTGGGEYTHGTVATLTATAKEGYEFLTWDDGVTTAERTVTVVEIASYGAIFAAAGATTYTITAVPNDASLGSVTGGGTYPEGTEVTLTATPKANAIFEKWSDGNTTNPRKVTVTGDANYVANFKAKMLYTITVESLNPEMGTVVGGGTFAEGTEVTIQAIPKGGYYFNGWNDGNHANPRTITVTGDATYKASFSAQQTQTYTLTVTCNPSEGYVEGTGSYTAGTKVTVKATAWSGYKFDKWNDGNTTNPREVTVNDNMTLVALFKTTGVGEYGETMLSVYPNPTKDNLRIDGVGAEERVEIYNGLGMLVKVSNTNSDQEIHVGDLAPGLYLIRCGERTARFIKE